MVSIIVDTSSVLLLWKILKLHRKQSESRPAAMRDGELYWIPDVLSYILKETSNRYVVSFKTREEKQIV